MEADISGNGGKLGGPASGDKDFEAVEKNGRTVASLWVLIVSCHGARVGDSVSHPMTPCALVTTCPYLIVGISA
jgi:hypothetical protein